MKDSIWGVRQEFKRKYQVTFGKEYDDTNKIIEFVLLKRLINNYGYDVVYLAINSFFCNLSPQKAHIMLFASKKFFSQEFQNLIINKDIAYYFRYLYSFDDKKVIALLDEYTDYTSANTLSDAEIARKKEILKELKEICNPQKLNYEHLVA